MTEQNELFPSVNAQHSLFGEGDDRMALSPPARRDREGDARARLLAVLAQARAAARMPWNARDLRYWQTVFPQLADRLPGEEADQMRFAFAREIERLKRAA